MKHWIPYPVSDRNQTITGVIIEGDYAEAAAYTDSINQTPMLYARWVRGVKGRRLIFSFSINRQEVDARNLPEKEAAWDPADYAQHLAATSLGPIDGEDRLTARLKGAPNSAKNTK